MSVISVEEARTLLGSHATTLDDEKIANLIVFLENLCNKCIEDVTRTKKQNN